MYNGLTVHMVVKNEEQWIWYSIMSIIDYVDRILICDTGSTDKTLEIIKSINNPKIELTELKNITAEEFPNIRQNQIEATKTNHFMIHDGDEIWNSKMFLKILNRIKENSDKLATFVQYFEFVNDIKHYYMGYEQKQFPLHNRKEYGWYTIRFVKKTEEVYCGNPYGFEGYFIGNQELQRYGKSEDYIWGTDIYYFHARNLLRSSSIEKDKEVMQRFEKRHLNKIGTIPKIYRGIEIEYPEVFNNKINF